MQTASGTAPYRRLLAKLRTSILAKQAKEYGIGPVRVFLLASKRMVFSNCPISIGKQPESLLSEKRTSIRVFLVFPVPMLFGISPVNSLLVNVRYLRAKKVKKMLLSRYPIFVVEAEVRSIALTHPQTEIKQRDTKIYVVVPNYYNLSIFLTVSPFKVSLTKFLSIVPGQIQNDNDFPLQNNARQVCIQI